jgi:C_GCAxxG_C_C family probable redox protein
MNREEKIQYAGDRFAEGMNCAQATFSALSDGSIDEATAFRIASCFGGGMRCGEVCGAVTGSLMAIGLSQGYHSSTDKEGKMRANDLAMLFENRFREIHGSILCRDLLKFDLSKPEELEKIRELHLFDTVCPMMVRDATRIADEVLAGCKK